MNDNQTIGRLFVLILGCLTALAALSIDISLPAIPEMSRALETTISRGQQIVAMFMAGIAVAQIPLGLLSDRYGRIPILYVGILIYTSASVVCTVAESIDWVLIGRFFQGAGAAGGLVIARAIVRDISTGKDASRLLSLMTMIFTAAPMLAPIAGAFLTSWFGWRIPFAVLGVFGLLMLGGIYYILFETKTPDRSERVGAQLMRSAKEFFSYSQSNFGLLMIVLPTASFLSIIASASPLVQEVYGYSIETFGLIFAVAGVSILLAAAANRRLVLHFSLMRVMGIGIGLVAIASIQLLVISWLNEGPFWWVWGNVCLFFFGAGLVTPNATALALDPLGSTAGVASSIIGSSQTFASAISAMAAALLYDGTVASCIIIIGVLGLVTVLLYFVGSLVLATNRAGD